MHFPSSHRQIRSSGALALAIAPALLLAPWPPPEAAVFGDFSFWLTVALAVIVSLLSACSIARPEFQPKRDPYYFLGECFVWVAMPLLWGIVAASVAFAWLCPLDLAGVVLAAVAGRWTAHRLCNLRWRNGGVQREDYISVLRGRKVTLEFRSWSR